MFHLQSKHKGGLVACGELGVDARDILSWRFVDRVDCTGCLEQLVLEAAERYSVLTSTVSREHLSLAQALPWVGKNGVAFFARMMMMEGVKTTDSQRAMLAQDVVRAAYGGRPSPMLLAAAMVACGGPRATNPVQAARGAAAAERTERVMRHAQVHAAMELAARFSPRKVYIASVWDRMEEAHSVWSRTVPGERGENPRPWSCLAEFKAWLLDENRSGLLVLARADMPMVMDLALVSRSEIRSAQGLGEFHFIVDTEAA